MEKTKITVVEDDVKLSDLIQKYLIQQGFDVNVIQDGSEAIDAILAVNPAVVILDLMLPGKDGLAICREVRPRYDGCILFLTASDDAMDHVAGVELGADDFLIKPVQPRVLLARIRMLLRRVERQSTNGDNASSAERPTKKNNDLTFGQLRLAHSKRAVSLANSLISLTTSEFDLLWLLATHAEEVLSRDFIYKNLRGIEYDGLDRSIDSKVAILRRKLGDNASMSTRIITVRGQGYLFVPDTWE
jgi:two-component system response regulator RstA